MISYNIIGNQLKVLQSKRMVGGSNFWAFREKKISQPKCGTGYIGDNGGAATILP